MTTGERINKYIASSGLCSRRAADKLIDEGKVLVNGIPADKGSTVTSEDIVTVEGREISKKEEKIYLAFNKPKGVVCTASKTDPDNIIDYINYPERIFTVGRLDKNSTGLILLTNDGNLSNRMLKASEGHEKEYVVAVDKPLTDNFIKKMAKGVDLGDKKTAPCKIRKTGDRTFDIILTQGINRQIRRMCEVLGYKVVRLKRIRFMSVELGDLPLGQYRVLTEDEINQLASN